MFQFSSVAQSGLTLCDPMNHSMPGLPVLTNSWSLPKLKSIESVMPSNHLILCLSLLLLPSIFPSVQVFSNESALPNTHHYMCREKMISNQYSREKTFLMHFFFFFPAKELQKTSIIKQCYKWYFWLHQRTGHQPHVCSPTDEVQVSFTMQLFLRIKKGLIFSKERKS